MLTITIYQSKATHDICKYCRFPLEGYKKLVKIKSQLDYIPTGKYHIECFLSLLQEHSITKEVVIRIRFEEYKSPTYHDFKE